MRRSGRRPHDRAGATTQGTKQDQLGRSILSYTVQNLIIAQQGGDEAMHRGNACTLAWPFGLRGVGQNCKVIFKTIPK